MKKRSLIEIFLRSFFIHASLNFRRMQNLGFAYAMIPIIRGQRLHCLDEQEMLTRNLQMFNTHPYLSMSLIGSLVRMEEDRPDGQASSPIIMVKQSLMGPYAAIGDTFFWSALRPCAGIISVCLVWMGWIFAPLAFMLIFTPAHIWVRLKGFLEGYRRGKQGIEFIRIIDLPRIAVKVRWLSLMALAVGCTWLLRDMYLIFAGTFRFWWVSAMLAAILFCWLLIKKGVTQIYILYGTAILLLIFSLKELLIWW
jgi:mannose PTS system EIID component